MSDNQGVAQAFGETTHTHVQRQGNSVTASSFASSTGAHPPHFERTSTAGGASARFDSMSSRELKDWLQARGVDLSGCIERSDLVDLAKRTYANS